MGVTGPPGKGRAVSTRSMRACLTVLTAVTAAIAVVFTLGVLRGAGTDLTVRNAAIATGEPRRGPGGLAAPRRSLASARAITEQARQNTSRLLYSKETPKPPNLSDSIQITRAIRNHTIQSICQAEQVNDLSLLEPSVREALTHQIIVDDERRFLYCYVPKVACSNWKRVIKFMQGTIADIGARLKMDHKNGLVFLDSFSEAEVQHRLRTYFKFMFVRDPLERLLSAYRNKFGDSALSAYKERFAPGIIRRYRAGGWDGRDRNVTLEEFVRFLLDSRPAKMDHHWRPMHLLCQPCAVRYDFVGSFEHLDEDAGYVLERIRGDTGAYFPRRQGWYHPTTEDKVRTLLNSVDPVYIQRFVDKYILDFITFGYAPPKQYYSKFHESDEDDIREDSEEVKTLDNDPRGSEDS